jgi:hypothetical protein
MALYSAPSACALARIDVLLLPVLCHVDLEAESTNSYVLSSISSYQHVAAPPVRYCT